MVVNRPTPRKDGKVTPYSTSASGVLYSLITFDVVQYLIVSRKFDVAIWFDAKNDNFMGPLITDF